MRAVILCLIFYPTLGFTGASFDITSLFKFLSKKQTRQTCTDFKSFSFLHNVEPDTRGANSNFSTWKCSDVFAKDTSSLSFYDELEDEDLGWWGLCSSYIYKPLKESGLDSLSSYYAQFDYWRDGHNCGAFSPEDHNQVEEDFVEEVISQSLFNRTPLNKLEKKDLKSDVKILKDKIAQTCCENNEECLSFFKKTKITFCKPSQGVMEHDECLARGAYMSYPNKQQKRESRYFNKRYTPGSLKGYPKLKTEIVIPPYKSLDGHTDWSTAKETITHELFHSCSNVLRVLKARAGDKGASETIENYCDVTPESKEAYISLLRNLGYSDESLKCFSKIVYDGFYLPGSNEPCVDFCEQANWEELYASAAYLSRDFIIKDLDLGKVCMGKKSDVHPAQFELVECAMKTKTIREMVKQRIMCTEN